MRNSLGTPSRRPVPRRRLSGSRARPILAGALSLSMLAVSQVNAQEGWRVKEAQARRTDLAPVIDGVVDPGEWRQAVPITDFRQREPDNGHPASEATEARILYDDEAIYFAFVMHDSQPERIVATDLVRDSEMRSDDTVTITLDTFRDRRNGFIFRVNALGAQYDALLRNEGRVNDDWNERWITAARITDSGWEAEIAIPLRALRFDSGTHTWGMDIQRQLRRRNEEINWNNWVRGFHSRNVSQAGDLVGLRDLGITKRFRLKPYVSGAASQVNQTDEPFREATGDIGLENFKYQITPNLTADFTANTDFAQVEDDDERINLTRFPLFFPEKREFFLEGANNFAFGSGGGFRGGGGRSTFPTLYHSRRVGLFESEGFGTVEVPIRYGARVTGKLGGTTIGALNAQTGDSEHGTGQNFTALRARQDIFARSSVGAIFTNVQGGGRHNRVYGVDGTFRFLEFLSIDGAYAQVDDSDLVARPATANLSARWSGDLWQGSASYTRVDPEFDSDLGFVRRRDIVSQRYSVGWSPRPAGGPIRQFRNRASIVYLTDTDGLLLTREQDLETRVNFQSGDSVEIGIQRTFERLDEEFEVEEGSVVPPGDYTFTELRASLNTYDARKFSGELELGGGGFFNGTRYSVEVSGSARWNANFNTRLEYELNRVSIPGGVPFNTHLVSFRANYNFSANWLTSALVQYNSQAERFQVFARLNYVYRGGFDNIFLVFKQSSRYGDAFDGATDRQLLSKITYSWDF